jgi:hypothetical protein
MTGGIQTPTCPLCSQPPRFILAGGHQAWCGTEGCQALTWDMYLDIDTLMENMSPAKITETRADE